MEASSISAIPFPYDFRASWSTERRCHSSKVPKSDLHPTQPPNEASPGKPWSTSSWPLNPLKKHTRKSSALCRVMSFVPIVGGTHVERSVQAGRLEAPIEKQADVCPVPARWIGFQLFCQNPVPVCQENQHNEASRIQLLASHCP